MGATYLSTGLPTTKVKVKTCWFLKRDEYLFFIQIEEDILDDPFKLNSGGLVTGKDMKGYKTKNDAYDVGTQFYKETHIRLLRSC